MLSPALNSPAPTTCFGSVELTLSPRDGRTRLVESRTRPPLQVQRALYPDRNVPHLALVMLANPTGGVFQGDHHHIKINVESGGAAHVTTQSSTKVHSMPDGWARQDVHLYVASGGYLEYLPDPVIPFRDSDFEQRTAISVEPGGVLVFWDVLTPGRVAMGESFRYRRFANRLEVKDGEGGTGYRDSFEIVPSRRNPLAQSVPGLPHAGHRGNNLGAMLLIADAPNLRELLGDMQRALSTCGDVSAGVTRLPNRAGLGIRVLGAETAAVQAALKHCWGVIRGRLLEVDLPFLRKY